jgi:hypothetical protein
MFVGILLVPDIGQPLKGAASPLFYRTDCCIKYLKNFKNARFSPLLVIPANKVADDFLPRHGVRYGRNRDISNTRLSGRIWSFDR